MSQDAATHSFYLPPHIGYTILYQEGKFMVKKEISVSCVYAGKDKVGKIIEQCFISYLRRALKCEKK